MRKCSMKKQLLLCFMALTLPFISSSCSRKKSEAKLQQALERLIKGNNRYVNNKSEHPNRSEERRKEISLEQSPFAIIVACSDSRVAPEIIFDDGLGDLFVVRVAGNIIGPTQLESIEYSALHLHSAIILVIGHENCGAVDAVVQHKAQDMEKIAELIEPAIQKARESKTDNLLESAIKLNAVNMKHFLENSPNIKQLIENKKIEVQAAYYNLKTGRVEILPN